MLLGPEATAAVRQGFAALGPQGQALFDQFMAAVRLSLTDAITGLFADGCAFMVVGFLVSFLMVEVPLRKAVPAGETAADPPMSGELATDVAEAGQLAAPAGMRPDRTRPWLERFAGEIVPASKTCRARQPNRLRAETGRAEP